MLQPDEEMFSKLVIEYSCGDHVDCRGVVASVRDSYTDDPSLIPVLLVVASW